MTEAERRALKRLVREARARRPSPLELVRAELRFGRCAGITVNDERCRYAAQEGSEYCHIHEPNYSPALADALLERLHADVAAELEGRL